MSMGPQRNTRKNDSPAKGPQRGQRPRASSPPQQGPTPAQLFERLHARMPIADGRVSFTVIAHSPQGRHSGVRGGFAAMPIVPLGDATYVVMQQMGADTKIRTYGSRMLRNPKNHQLEVGTNDNRQAFSTIGKRLPATDKDDLYRALNQSLQAIQHPRPQRKIALPRLWVQVRAAGEQLSWAPAIQPVMSDRLRRLINTCRPRSGEHGCHTPKCLVVPCDGFIAAEHIEEKNGWVFIPIVDEQGSPQVCMRIPSAAADDNSLADLQDPDGRWPVKAGQVLTYPTANWPDELYAKCLWSELSVELPGYAGRFMELDYLAPCLAAGHEPRVILEDFRDLLGVEVPAAENLVARALQHLRCHPEAAMEIRIDLVRRHLGRFSDLMTNDDIRKSMEPGAPMFLSGLARPQAWIETCGVDMQFRLPGWFIDFGAINKVWRNDFGPSDRRKLSNNGSGEMVGHAIQEARVNARTALEDMLREVAAEVGVQVGTST